MKNAPTPPNNKKQEFQICKLHGNLYPRYVARYDKNGKDLVDLVICYNCQKDKKLPNKTTT